MTEPPFGMNSGISAYPSAHQNKMNIQYIIYINQAIQMLNLILHGNDVILWFLPFAF